VRVLLENRIEDGIRDLIAYLVRVSFGYGLRSKKIAVLGPAHAKPPYYQ
jgi:hypothetical protein